MQMFPYLLCSGTLAMMSGGGQKVTLMLNGLEQGHFGVFFLLIQMSSSVMHFTATAL
jgi:hypothetical protein